MKINYRNCEIEVTREKSLGEDTLLYYSVFDEDGFEVTSGYSEGDDTIKDYIKYMKEIVDDFRENPDDYYDDFDDEDDDFISDSEWAKSIDYGGYDSEDEFWEHLYKM